MKTITKDRAIGIAEKHYLTAVVDYIMSNRYAKQSIMDAVNSYLNSILMQKKATKDINRLLTYIIYKT